MPSSYIVEYSDMIDQHGIKAALVKIHETFAFNGFANLNDIEKILVYSPTKIDVYTTNDIKHYEYDHTFKKLMYITSTSNKSKTP
ncbi:hypothetical protein [Gottfriedia solisilvae]|uniref:hypothetical protein n=1 Tax=Gottfriedia solisilvae TaxID=1516104 RepID=UPI003D2F3A91